ncbi:MAG: acyltransferase domain-containing protein [Anaerolineae bacterium]|nr:acyltransferase domain-containing protein [Anaerolineae bacterium]
MDSQIGIDVDQTPVTTSSLRTTPIAIIGLAGIFAQSSNAETFWDNILNKIDCITEVPRSRWQVEDYFDPDLAARDKVYCKRGGFLPDIDFDPLEFGIPPNILEVTDVSQLLGLVVARDVLIDAGYGEEIGESGKAGTHHRSGRVFDRSRTGVVLGVAGGQKLITPLTARLQYPVWERVLRSYGLPDDTVAEIVDKMKLAYIEWNENAFPGLLGNVIAGRIANRFDLGGMNCVVDAACASSLSAIKMSISQLLEGRADMMITGGVDTDNSAFTYMCFSKTPAFSQGEVPRPFDADADGMMVGEGIGMLVLKRMTDAERDGDRIYAVIRGIGASSDGRYKSIYAPRPEGQALALRRAYADAGVSPLSVGLIEAHGTGTRAGDPAEFAGLMQVFGSENGHGQTIALGSVKSQIGHTKAAAGAAGMIKAALALDQKVLPPTLNVDKPNPAFDLGASPFYINTETRPWIRPGPNTPRRAGVSAFGFGGTNYHVVLEEYSAEYAAGTHHRSAYRLCRVAQPVILYAADPAALLNLCEERLQDLQGTDREESFAALTTSSRAPRIPVAAARLGFVADSLDEARDLLEGAVKMLRMRPESDSWEHPKGITYRREGLDPTNSVVALFPGQGAQYVNMGRELAVNFPPLREVYADMDARFEAEGQAKLSTVVFAPPAFDAETVAQQNEALQATDYAQAGIGVFSAGLFRLLHQAGFRPNFTAGHSFGELSALWAGGVLRDDDFMRLVKARGKAMRPPANPDFDAGGMAAVQGALSDVEREVAAFGRVVIANQNSNSQVVLAGPTADIQAAHDVLTAKGFKVTILPVSAAFHTPLVEHASKPFAEAVAPTLFQTSDVVVYSNTTGEPYPKDPEEAKALLANHILNPVLFKRQIENVYAAGGRIFVECGPRRIATGLVEDILDGKPYIAIALNPSRSKSSDRQFREAVVQLRVVGLELDDVDPYDLHSPLRVTMPVHSAGA